MFSYCALCLKNYFYLYFFKGFVIILTSFPLYVEVAHLFLVDQCYFVRFQVFTAVTVTNGVFWDVGVGR
jgi:hypothetical protein